MSANQRESRNPGGRLRSSNPPEHVVTADCSSKILPKYEGMIDGDQHSLAQLEGQNGLQPIDRTQKDSARWKHLDWRRVVMFGLFFAVLLLLTTIITLSFQQSAHYTSKTASPAADTGLPTTNMNDTPAIDEFVPPPGRLGFCGMPGSPCVRRRVVSEESRRNVALLAVTVTTITVSVDVEAVQTSAFHSGASPEQSVTGGSWGAKATSPATSRIPSNRISAISNNFTLTAILSQASSIPEFVPSSAIPQSMDPESADSSATIATPEPVRSTLSPTILSSTPTPTTLITVPVDGRIGFCGMPGSPCLRR